MLMNTKMNWHEWNEVITKEIDQYKTGEIKLSQLAWR